MHIQVYPKATIFYNNYTNIIILDPDIRYKECKENQTDSHTNILQYLSSKKQQNIKINHKQKRNILVIAPCHTSIGKSITTSHANKTCTTHSQHITTFVKLLTQN